MKYDVIIIGSGFGGLVCGHILSKQGKNVLLLERQAQPRDWLSIQACTMWEDWRKDR